MIGYVKRNIRLLMFKKAWRQANSMNMTTPVNLFPAHCVSVGKYSYGPLEVHTWGTEGERLQIGKYVSIASGVKFLLGGNHCIDTFSTYPFKVKVMGEKREAWTKGAIIIEDDVWIGTDAMILSGVIVGQGAVVAARSVVTRNVPPYAIVAGNPAKVVKYRFNKELVEKMMGINFEKVDETFVKNNIEDLYKKMDIDILKELLSSIENRNE